MEDLTCSSGVVKSSLATSLKVALTAAILKIVFKVNLSISDNPKRYLASSKTSRNV